MKKTVKKIVNKVKNVVKNVVKPAVKKIVNNVKKATQSATKSVSQFIRGASDRVTSNIFTLGLADLSDPNEEKRVANHVGAVTGDIISMLVGVSATVGGGGGVIVACGTTACAAAAWGTGVAGGGAKNLGQDISDLINMFSRGKGGSAVDNNLIRETATMPKKGGETVVGHALQKHAGRNPDILGKVKGGSNEINNQVLNHLNEILDAPGSFSSVTNNRGISFLEKQLPDGRGIRLNLDGTFKGFIDQ